MMKMAGFQGSSCITQCMETASTTCYISEKSHRMIVDIDVHMPKPKVPGAGLQFWDIVGKSEEKTLVRDREGTILKIKCLQLCALV